MRDPSVTRKLIYSMGASLDGFVAGPAGEIGWSAPDEELHRFHNEQTREIDVQLCGRRLYETMVYWETADDRPGLADFELEFARIWQAIPKLVFSTTLEKVDGNARLATGRLADEVAELKAQPGGDLAVGGAGLAGGAGTPYFPGLAEPIDLELIETRTFGSRVVYLRYRVTPEPTW
jgi:dihydrofolate reductase